MTRRKLSFTVPEDVAAWLERQSNASAAVTDALLARMHGEQREHDVHRAVTAFVFHQIDADRPVGDGWRSALFGVASTVDRLAVHAPDRVSASWARAAMAYIARIWVSQPELSELMDGAVVET